MTDARHLAALLILLFAAGCCGPAPTRTAGTAGLAAQDLSLFSIAPLPAESPVQIRTVRFDGASDEYGVGAGRDFYLLPGDRTASFTLSVRIPKVGGAVGSVFFPKGGFSVPGPREVPLGTLAAGKAYELIRPTEDFALLLEGGNVSLAREKVK